MQKQSTLRSFLNISKDEDSDQESVYTPSPEKQKNTIPLQWTRVRDARRMINTRITAFDVEKDLETDQGLKAIRKGAVREDGVIIFDPDQYQGMKDELKIPSFTLDQN